MGIGSQQILLILVIALVIFGANKLPQIGDGLGKAIKNFKKASNETEDALDITPEADKKKIDNDNKDA